MTIECYDSKCVHHSCHYDPDGGPFCDMPACIKSKIYYCVVCGKNVVDAENGFDTCLDCEKQI
jgi:hypothetical protein